MPGHRQLFALQEYEQHEHRGEKTVVQNWWNEQDSSTQTAWPHPFFCHKPHFGSRLFPKRIFRSLHIFLVPVPQWITVCINKTCHCCAANKYLHSLLLAHFGNTHTTNTKMLVSVTLLDIHLLNIVCCPLPNKGL